jgi:hypothetical protein
MFGSFAIAACAARHENSVNSVTVAFSGFGCEMLCPDYVIGVDSALTVTYYGASSAERNGYFVGTITTAQWDSVQQRFEGFLDHGVDTMSFGRTDHPDFEMVIDGKEQNLHLHNNTGNLTDSARAAVHWVMGLIDRASNVHQTDTIVFATTEQYRRKVWQDEMQTRLNRLDSIKSMTIDSTTASQPSRGI